MIQREDFLSRVNKTNTCWLWTRYITQAGYGQISLEGRKLEYAHRLSYKLFVGEIPKGKVIDHICRVRHCVNPTHLEVVDNKTNLLRGIGPTAINAKKTNCNKGHEFTPENTYISPKGRSCKTCRREARLAYLDRQKVML